MIDFFRDNLIVHTHIPKTAGSTLTRGFIRAFGRERVCDTRGDERPEALTAEARSAVYLLAGHFHYGSRHVDFFGRTPIYLACVRPPLERYRSAYDFVRTRTTHPDHRRVAGKTLRETVVDLQILPKKQINFMTRALTRRAGIPAEALFKHVEENYLIVTPHERVNDTLGELMPLLGTAPVEPDLHRNRTRDPTAEDYGNTRTWFENANRLDSDLVRFVEDNYERWLRTLPERLEVLMRQSRS
ncbi:MAG: sulfotransferase family 2 domain-containing protein [Alphaproteobacteria bacterium]|nr:sulfotransferase family 2 domain-containing protein [Alphaproteobacteria bacterium]